MPDLTEENPRWEKFCQLLSAGSSLINAYEQCGYETGTKGSAYTNASNLFKNPKIKARVKELNEEAALRVGVTKEWVMREAKESYYLFKGNESAASSAKGYLDMLAKSVNVYADKDDKENASPVSINIEGLK